MSVVGNITRSGAIRTGCLNGCLGEPGVCENRVFVVCISPLGMSSPCV